MKFITPFISLIAAATIAFANPGEQNKTEQNKTQTGLCDTYIDCLISIDKINLNSLDSTCSSFTSDKCQKIYHTTEFEKAYEDCVNNNRAEYGIFSYLTLKLLCTKDEKGNYCTIAKISIDRTNLNPGDEKYNQVINDTCKSKLCYDAYYEYMEFVLDKDMPREKEGELMKTIKSAQCTSQHQEESSKNNCKEQTSNLSVNSNNKTNEASSNTKTSDASILTTSRALIITTVLLILTLI